MAYILGTQEFWGLGFSVTPSVLIPRPETEIIVESALELLPEASPLQVADIGTGSGCLAIALAHERAGAQVVAVDISGAALEVAAANAIGHGVAGRITFVVSDLLDSPLLDGRTFDLIVANPPYVAEADRSTLPPEVREHEPAAALFGGGDGLTVIRRLTAQSVTRLNPGGYLIFEIGIGQDQAVRTLISETSGLTIVDLRKDLQGIPRTVVARRSSLVSFESLVSFVF